MNLSIQDGRAELWQWDTGVRLVMDEACEAVNLSEDTFGVTVDVTAAEDGKTWVAAVPDEMLQKPGDLICYAVQSTATGTITAAYRSFRVNRRPKPAGYVATPTEARTWQELDDRKIDAPQTAQVGEVLTVEKVDEDGKPTKWKTSQGVDITTELTQESTDTQVPSAKAAYDAIGKKIDKNQGVKNAGKILGIDADGNVIPQNKPVQALAGAAAPTTATAGVVGQEYYVIVNNAVTEMYVCTSALNGSYTWDKVEFGGGTDKSLGITSATVGQIAKITAVDSAGKPTAWEAVDMPSGGGGGGHWETVLDTVWEQDVINPTAFDSGTGIFTCAEGELNNLELNKAYIFYPQCVKEGVAFNTIINDNIVKVTKLSDTTFSIDATPPTTFVPTNVKFSKGACLAVTDIDAKKIRLTLDGQFQPTATLYDKPFYGTKNPFFGRNTGYVKIRNAYQAYQQVTAEVESPYRIVGEILCGFNAPSANASFHFKNNSFCCPLVPYDVPEGNERTYFLNSDGTKIAKLYSTRVPWHLDGGSEDQSIINDCLKIISGTKVKLERWVE